MLPAFDPDFRARAPDDAIDARSRGSIFRPRLSAELETAYAVATAEERRHQYRFFLLIGILLMVLCLGVDALVSREQLIRGITLRLGLAVPLHAMGFWLLGQRRSRGVEGLSIVIPVGSSVFATAYLSLGLPPVLADRYVISAAVLGTAIVIAAPLRFRDAASILVLGMGTICSLSFFISGARSESLLSVVVFASVGSVAALAINMRTNRDERRAFLLRERSDRYAAALEQANAKLHILSATDQLTGLPNRRHFEIALAAAWSLAANTRTSLGLMMVDIDHFKRFNDLHGHMQGDLCLREIGAVIAAQVHANGGTLCRYGGEEFVVILPGADFDLIEKVGEDVRIAVQDRPLTSCAGSKVTVSVGVAAQVAARGDDPEDVLHAADMALYEAKAAGRNCVAPATAPPWPSAAVA